MPKLVAIGDSLTQGVQNGAIFRPYLSYPALIADSMGLDLTNEFRVPKLPGSGLPFNLEWFLRSLRDKLGTEIDRGEWIWKFPFLLEDFMDEIEDYYERGRGSRPASYDGIYHNLAVASFRVRDSFTVNAAYCSDQIDRAEGWWGDDFLGLPSAPMYRIARCVLNPRFERESNQRAEHEPAPRIRIPNSSRRQRQDPRNAWTQIDNLRELNNSQEGPVENLIVFFGANDCLGTVVDLKVNDMEGVEKPSKDPQKRRETYNLTSTRVFKCDYEKMVEAISSAISEETQVFVGTVPPVTIPPITQGIRPVQSDEADGNGYFKYYGAFFSTEENFDPRHRHLTEAQVRHIDRRVDAFNRTIREIVDGRERWHIVDIHGLLNRLAVKRNNMSIASQQPLHGLLREDWRRPDHPLLSLNPIPSVLRLDTRDTQRLSGGLFSLDCVHPTTIGYGLIAEAFLREMQEAGVPGANPNSLRWSEIIRQDSIIRFPPVLWDDIINAAESNATLWDMLFRMLT